MKSVIHKYILVATEPGEQTIVIPQEAEFLKADSKLGSREIVLWYSIPLSMLETSEFRKLLLVWTGKLFERSLYDKYLGTVENYELVWHIFDITDRE